MDSEPLSVANAVESSDLFALLGLPTPPLISQEDRAAELEAQSIAFVKERRRHDRIRRYEVDCIKGYPVSDWSYPQLAPYLHAIDRVRSWQYGKKGLLLSGATGRGKTRSVFDLYRRLAHEGDHDIRFWFAGDWFARLQEEVKFGRDDARGWVEASAAHPVVIIDDLGQEALTTARADWAASHFFRFLDLRIIAGLPLIVSTNLTADEIAGKMNQGSGVRQEPLIRRLLELTDVVKFQPRESP